jgi:hypothetical protein
VGAGAGAGAGVAVVELVDEDEAEFVVVLVDGVFDSSPSRSGTLPLPAICVGAEKVPRNGESLVSSSAWFV